eukprot:NODE_483_length_1619_cov_392.016561_g367_i0.p1 GENE.NODE_483_length_1619_cov_392.016561_g367_i0~~NODE_483_length_1619_cov_392.016561_g367_i0.p1  ORF type:complete len:530 (+),score=131.56 NODE_483_length_1619_cov_392.016561_g367_i0:54-1592(+)
MPQGSISVPKKKRKAPTLMKGGKKRRLDRGPKIVPKKVVDVRPPSIACPEDVTRSADLPVSEGTQEAVMEMGFTNLLPLQQKVIPPLFSGRDMDVKVTPGSGRTLCYAIPIVEVLVSAGYDPTKYRTGAVVMTATRELCVQIQGVVAQLLVKHKGLSHCCCFGGRPKQAENGHIYHGMAVIIGTPGRLLEHIRATPFAFEHTRFLIIDDLDRVVKSGYTAEVRAIAHLLPANRQTAVFWTRSTTEMADLIKLVCLPDRLSIALPNMDPVPVQQCAKQHYAVVPADKRFLLLYSLVNRNRHKKTLVLLSATHVVQFFFEVFETFGVSCLELHAKLTQQKQREVISEFSSKSSGLLFCTNVLGPKLFATGSSDWVIQFDPPDDADEYARQFRMMPASDRKLLVCLMPTELGFVKFMENAGVTTAELKYSSSELPTAIQQKLEKSTDKSYVIYKGARDAYRAFMLCYYAQTEPGIFDFSELDVRKLAFSFGLQRPPAVWVRKSDISGVKVKVKAA